MKLKVPWANFIMFGTFSLLGLTSVICALAFRAALPAFIVASATFVGFLVVFIIVFFKWALSEPDFITKHGTAVWTDEIKIIDKYHMDTVLDFYINNLPKYSPVDITTGQLEYMLKDAKIEWSRKRISAIGIGWEVKDKAGLQSGKNVKVYWEGSIINSALYHELTHMVDEIVLGLPPDYKHERKEWWDIIPKLKNEFARQA